MGTVFVIIWTNHNYFLIPTSNETKLIYLFLTQTPEGNIKRLIVINEIRQISRKKLDFANFRKLQEAIWLTVINEIFEFSPHFNPFGYLNYLDELSLV